MSALIEPDWYADDFGSWGEPDEWPPDWHLKAKAALIRHFSRIDLTVSKDENGWHVRIPQSRSWSPGHKPCQLLEMTAYLQGFLDACEAMTDQWDCRERNADGH